MKKAYRIPKDSVNHDHTYSYGKVRCSTKTSFALYDGLQQMASNELHFSPKVTMSLCQNCMTGYIIYED